MAQDGSVLAAHAHQPGIRTAYNRTFARECDAARQYLNTVFFQTLRCTVLALGSTLVARFDAISEDGRAKYFVVHIKTVNGKHKSAAFRPKQFMWPSPR